MSDQYQDLLEHLHAQLGHAIRRRRLWFKTLNRDISAPSEDGLPEVLGRSLLEVSGLVEGMAVALSKVASASGGSAANYYAWKAANDE